MKQFSYYLYDNCESTQICHRADDPRRFLNTSADGVLSAIVSASPGCCRYTSLCSEYSSALTDPLINIGLLRRHDDFVLLDSTVIITEDIENLIDCFSAPISFMADRLEQNKEEIYRAARQLDNGFLPEVNLYHILCGHIFDGLFFDFLSRKSIVSTSRMHASGLDYIITVYENTPALDAFSKKLPCSYNRFTDGFRTLQSFGDSDGSRVDFFRFSMQKALGTIPASLAEIEKAWDRIDCDHNKSILLYEMQRLTETGQCAHQYAHLLSLFGYAHNGKIIVPVYRKKHLPVINAIEQMVEELLCKDVEAALLTAGKQSNLLCSKHGVAPGEIANELYHVVFGQLNQVLIARKFVSEPAYYPEEGRYLKSIELM